MKRTIHLFPEFSNIQNIEILRIQYDPLFKLILPHITLVFPFESTISTQALYEHIQWVLKDINPFLIKLHDFTGTFDQYIFLNVKKGNDQIIELHDRLYSGLLSNFRDFRFSFHPHLTIGKFRDEKMLVTALAKMSLDRTQFETEISKIYVTAINGLERTTEFIFNF
ncbi:MAG: 2'-5' RNA ligase family protein [Parachlamydiaceae bacterium]|nr:2'-5' RNA ligase family protein [Parachlamydiaceae bacterium]